MDPALTTESGSGLHVLGDPELVAACLDPKGRPIPHQVELAAQRGDLVLIQTPAQRCHFSIRIGETGPDDPHAHVRPLNLPEGHLWAGNLEENENSTTHDSPDGRHFDPGRYRVTLVEKASPTAVDREVWIRERMDVKQSRRLDLVEAFLAILALTLAFFPFVLLAFLILGEGALFLRAGLLFVAGLTVRHLVTTAPGLVRLRRERSRLNKEWDRRDAEFTMTVTPVTDDRKIPGGPVETRARGNEGRPIRFCR